MHKDDLLAYSVAGGPDMVCGGECCCVCGRPRREPPRRRVDWQKVAIWACMLGVSLVAWRLALEALAWLWRVVWP